MRKHLNIRPGSLIAATGPRAIALTAAAVLGLSAAAFAPAADAATVTVTSHFVWQPNAASLSGDTTFINNGATNDQHGDLLFVTLNLTPGGISPCPCLLSPFSPVGVWYQGSSERWGIFREDRNTMGALFSYNVLVVPRASKSVFVHKASSSNSRGDYTVISSPLTNRKPDAVLEVTQDFNPGGAGGVYNPSQVGVRYYKSLKKWVIFNEDGTAIPPGAAFNVLVGQAASNGGTMTVLKATRKNRAGAGVLMSNAETNGNPNTVIFVTQDFNPGDKGGAADSSTLMAAYSGTKEGVANWAAGRPGAGTAFNVLIFSS